MKKGFFLLFLLVLSLSACGREQPPAAVSTPGPQHIELTVWGAEEDEALLREIFASFQAHYAGEATFQLTYQPQSESNCKEIGRAHV